LTIEELQVSQENQKRGAPSAAVRTLFDVTNSVKTLHHKTAARHYLAPFKPTQTRSKKKKMVAFDPAAAIAEKVYKRIDRGRDQGVFLIEKKKKS
jgi:hypothetical protein